MVEPKYKRPVKDGNTWAGLTFMKYPEGHPTKPEYPWRWHCPAPLCFMVIHAATEEIADERIRKHPCPWFGGGTTTLSWGVMSDDYIGPIWLMIDREVDIIKGTAPGDLIDAKAKARAYADVLGILMVPFFSGGDEIVREALVRWQNRQPDGDPEYCTPGIGRLRYKKPQTTTRGDIIEEYDPAAPKKGPKHSLTDEEIAKIKASGTFPTKMLAAAYGTTEDVIKWIQAN